MASNTGMKAKHDGDRISKLPDSILYLILWWLPIKDAVSTSVLSTRWRYLFVSVFNLDVDFLMFGHPPPPRTVKSFMKFMDKMLFIHTEGRIEQFRLNHIDTSAIDASRVCGWICAALWRGVKDIDLVFSFNSNTIPRLPTSLLLTSKTLARLKLIVWPIMEPMAVPINVYLPCLKTLDLEYVVFEDDGSMNRLLSGCPVLEDLSISNCDMGNIKCLQISNPSLKSLTLHYNRIHLTFGIVIDLPSLVYFRYGAFTAKSFSINMPSLVMADIHINADIHSLSERDGLVEFFEGICNVTLLNLSIDLKALSCLSHKRFVAFQNLLQLRVLDFISKSFGLVLFQFLEFSPNLQTLVISCHVSKVWSPTDKVPACVVYQLKKVNVKVLDFDDESSLFEMVAYILKNATVLEKLTLCMPRHVEVKEKIKISQQLLSLPRSSNKCQVKIN